MSFKAMCWAAKAQTNTPVQKLVLLLLADRAGDEGTCFPSLSRIASDACMSKSAVIRNVKKLSDIGFVSVTRRTVPMGKKKVNTSNLYLLHIDTYPLGMCSGSRTPLKDSSLYPPSEGSSLKRSPEGGSLKRSPDGGSFKRSGVLANSDPNQSTEPTNNLKVSCPTSSRGDAKGNFKPAETKNPTPPNSAPPPKPKSVKKKKMVYSDTAIEMAERLSKGILKRDGHYHTLTRDKREDTLKRWANDIEKIHRLDKRSWGEISDVLTFAISDDFWSRNILSGAKLRKQFSALKQKIPTAKSNTMIPIKATKHSDTHVKIFFLDKKLASGGYEFKIITKDIARQNVDDGLWEVIKNK